MLINKTNMLNETIQADIQPFRNKSSCRLPAW